jgi:hypothetical protein
LFQAKALGRVLFDQVCKQLHLLEADYFGLEYQEPNGTKVRIKTLHIFQCSVLLSVGNVRQSVLKAPVLFNIPVLALVIVYIIKPAVLRITTRIFYG